MARFPIRIHPCPEELCLGRFFLKYLQEEGSFATKTISNARLLTAFRYSFGIEAGEFDNDCAFYWSFVEKNIWMGRVVRWVRSFWGFAMKCCQCSKPMITRHTLLAREACAWNSISSPLKRLTSAKTDIHKLGCSSFVSFHPGCFLRRKRGNGLMLPPPESSVASLGLGDLKWCHLRGSLAN